MNYGNKPVIKSQLSDQISDKEISKCQTDQRKPDLGHLMINLVAFEVIQLFVVIGGISASSWLSLNVGQVFIKFIFAPSL